MADYPAAFNRIVFAVGLVLQGAKEHEVADHIINVLQNSKKVLFSCFKLLF